MKDVSYDGSDLTIGDETVTFGREIIKVLIVSTKILVLFDPDAPSPDETNLVAFDDAFNRFWGVRTSGDSTQAVFTDVFERDGTVIAKGADGTEYQIDLYTGWAEEIS